MCSSLGYGLVGTKQTLIACDLCNSWIPSLKQRALPSLIQVQAIVPVYTDQRLRGLGIHALAQQRHREAHPSIVQTKLGELRIPLGTFIVQCRVLRCSSWPQ